MSTQPASAPVQVRVAPTPSNGLGIAGFVCSILGFLSCGMLSPIGLLLSFFALFKRPRGMAVAGLILGLIGSLWVLAIAAVVVAVGVIPVAAVLGIAMFNEQITAYVAAQDIHTHYDQHGALPTQNEGDQIMFNHQDMNGYTPQYTPTGPTTFTLSLPGDDRAWGTSDDYAQTFDVTQMTNFNTNP